MSQTGPAARPVDKVAQGGLQSPPDCAILHLFKRILLCPAPPSL